MLLCDQNALYTAAQIHATVTQYVEGNSNGPSMTVRVFTKNSSTSPQFSASVAVGGLVSV